MSSLIKYLAPLALISGLSGCNESKEYVLSSLHDRPTVRCLDPTEYSYEFYLAKDSSFAVGKIYNHGSGTAFSRFTAYFDPKTCGLDSTSAPNIQRGYPVVIPQTQTLEDFCRCAQEVLKEKYQK